ncbi:AraC family transcriptional regulator [Persicobacter psychrovividus]|uniref:HTH araC/xylS-type domain-containing protein n=1 Tax=Persicobacter psychrovividus TaxID=387638 RepID=A0ABM7VG95_9BACT|nr:hypothetical protein PEPS_19980 [Persicobacter psychrovividus]
MSLILKEFNTDSLSTVWGMHLYSFGELFVPAEESKGGVSKNYQHSFWQKGRVLDTFFLVYISEGAGEFQVEDQPLQQVNPGDCLILYPGIRHRYRPLPDKGWREHWVGLSGRSIDQLLSHYKVLGKQQRVPLKEPSVVLGILAQVKQEVLQEREGFQVRACCELQRLLSMIFLQVHQGEVSTSRKDQLLRKAKIRMQEQAVNSAFNMPQLAAELGVSYVWFRKAFRMETGYAPQQYKIGLQIKYAGNLLTRTTMTVKEVAFAAGFDSEAYFCRQFKKVMLKTPSAYRKGAL